MSHPGQSCPRMTHKCEESTCDGASTLALKAMGSQPKFKTEDPSGPTKMVTGHYKIKKKQTNKKKEKKKKRSLPTTEK